MDTRPTIWERLQTIDPRWLYVAAIVVVVVPLLSGYTAPNIPSQVSEQSYVRFQRIAQAHPHGFVLISADWTNSTRGESQWQSLAALRQIMLARMRFALVTFDPRTHPLMQADIDTINAELSAARGPAYHPYLYGRDYCFWGYKPPSSAPQFLQGLAENVPATVRVDFRGTPVSLLPCMAGVVRTSDIAAIVLLTNSNTLDNWLQFIVHGGKPPLFYFPTSVMAPEGYPYLDSGQIAGIVAGVKGAADYEQMEGLKHGFGETISTALSMIYFLILLLILVGNVGAIVARRRSAERQL